MTILAIEQSTSCGSVAVVRDGAQGAEHEWVAPQARGQQLFSVVPELLAGLQMSLDDVTCFAVGLGPGAFTSLRIAVSAARAYALPGKAPVAGIPSDAALALRVHAETGSSHVSVIGDARRDRLWISRYEVADGQCTLREPRVMVTQEQFTPPMLASDIVVTPDWDRLGEQMERMHGDLHVLAGAHVPHAIDIARLAATGTHDQPLAPIYLHPPVFVEPRFPLRAST